MLLFSVELFGVALILLSATWPTRYKKKKFGPGYTSPCRELRHARTQRPDGIVNISVPKKTTVSGHVLN